MMIPIARKTAPRAPQIKVSSPEHVLPAEREPLSVCVCARARERESKDERASGVSHNTHVP